MKVICHFIAVCATCCSLLGTARPDAHPVPARIRVTVWDEEQPDQKQAYDDFLGHAIAEHLRNPRELMSERFGEISVVSVKLDDPDQGLPKALLDDTDVLIWWGHLRHGEVKDELVKDIVERLKAGKLALIALHSAHWSKPFTAAMNARAIEDALNSLPANERATASVVTIPPDRRLMDRNERLTPYFTREIGDSGKIVLKVKLPSCAFPAVSNDGLPSHVTTLLPNHPIAKGVPRRFDIPKTEMYDAPFHVPTPDATIFEERWDAGQHFPSGDLWRVGKGWVFYFRPGHETYPIYKQPIPLRIIENAVLWLGRRSKAE